MHTEFIRTHCLSLPKVEEDVKWGNDLCFLIGKKMFCVTALEGEFRVSLKVGDEEFEELCARDGIIPAPYLARYKWILVQSGTVFSEAEWKHYINQSYENILSRLAPKVLKQLDIDR